MKEKHGCEDICDCSHLCSDHTEMEQKAGNRPCYLCADCDDFRSAQASYEVIYEPEMRFWFGATIALVSMGALIGLTWLLW